MMDISMDNNTWVQSTGFGAYASRIERRRGAASRSHASNSIPPPTPGLDLLAPYT